MDPFFTGILYVLTAILLGISFRKDRGKTMRSFRKAWNMFVNVLPQFLAILFLVGLLLTAVTPGTIKQVVGA